MDKKREKIFTSINNRTAKLLSKEDSWIEIPQEKAALLCKDKPLFLGIASTGNTKSALQMDSYPLLCSVQRRMGGEARSYKENSKS